MKQDWERFWSTLDEERSYLGKLMSFYRTQIVAKAVNFHINKWFKPQGIFVECGAGTSETTLRTRKANRTFVALDYSSLILEKTINNPKIDTCINADMFSLPFKDKSVDGIWNVGVMEHFTMDEIDRALNEFGRVLKENGTIILFWPMAYSPYIIFINALEFIVNTLFKRPFRIYPDEISRLRSRKQGKEIVEKNKFKNVKVFFNFRDAFSFGVVIGRKQ